MIADQCLLLRILLQDSLRDDVLRIFLCDFHLRETVADVLQRFRHEAEFRIVEDLLLNAENDAEIALGAHLSERTQHFQVENQLALVSGCQVGKELINNNQIPLVRVFGIEGFHHLTNDFLVVADR